VTSLTIVGIHGINNKPPAHVLSDWWENSLREGLARNQSIRRARLNFRLTYWADLLHETPMQPEDDPAPYVRESGDGVLPAARNGFRRRMAALGLEAVGKLAEVVARAPVLENLVEELVHERAGDLYRYHMDAGLRADVRQHLAVQLQAAQATRRPVVLIAHSMGSIIAYDVLRREPDAAIAHFITIGSPLGLAEVKGHAAREFGSPAVPAGVARWTNFADPRDPVAALDVRLRSDYHANARGVRIDDAGVRNTYVSLEGKANPHKVYGYLRTPEMSALIASMLRPNRTAGTHCAAGSPGAAG
jgi:pimeloyl-ACP methyl ester carboxylesterase